MVRKSLFVIQMCEALTDSSYSLEEFMVDLYTLGPDLLSKLWDYTETKMNFRPVLSPFSLVQANTAMMEDD